MPLALLAALSASACGSDDDGFDAESLVATLNEAGAGLSLGERLTTTDEGDEVRALAFAAGAPANSSRADGAIVVLGDEDAARDEFARCESAISFVCFRAANAVLRFSGIDGRERRRLSAALQRIETDPAG